MGTSALLLALTALWTGPEITQNNSWVGPVDQDRCSAIMQCVDSMSMSMSMTVLMSRR